jgi:hypothetical protein
VVSVVDWHDQSVSLLEIFLAEHPLDLSLLFGERVGREVGVQDAEGGGCLTDEPLLEHLHVDVYDIVVEPLTIVQAA